VSEAFLLVTGPADAGPAERREMLETARRFLDEAGVDEIVRVDVPAGGDGGDDEGAVLRAGLDGLVPVLQSGSLFGGRQGLELVDAHRLTAGDATVLAALVEAASPEAVAVAVVAEGSVPAVLAKVLKARGRTVAVKKVWESNALRWVTDEVRRRGLTIDAAGVQALVQRFGADIASLELALDQLAESRGRIGADEILDRFRNRPNVPIFHYTDAVAKGDVDEALRRLGDLLVHQHPLVILASLETELRRRAFALSSPDKATFVDRVGARPTDKWADRVWGQRGRLRDSSLRLALDALVRADRTLKTAPEETHQLTLERLTVAMCRWLTGR